MLVSRSIACCCASILLAGITPTPTNAQTTTGTGTNTNSLGSNAFISSTGFESATGQALPPDLAAIIANVTAFFTTNQQALFDRNKSQVVPQSSLFPLAGGLEVGGNDTGLPTNDNNQTVFTFSTSQIVGVQNPNTTVYKEPFILGDPLASYFPYIPQLGEYILGPGSQVQNLDVATITKTFSQRDWSRWDGYDTLKQAYVSPQRSAIANPPSTAADKYQALFNQVHSNTFTPIAYSWYVGFSRGSFDIYKNLVSSNNWDTPTFMQNVSIGIFQGYNLWRTSLLNSGQSQSQIDATDVPWNTLPKVGESMTWAEQYMTALFSIQQMTHTSITVAGSPFPPYDAFGILAKAQSFGVGFNQFQHIFDCAPIGQVLSHYAAYWSTPFLHSSRKNAMAALTALDAALTTYGRYEQASTAQWFTRIAGAITLTNYLIQSEAELRKRGAWSDSQDGVTTSNKPNGAWTNSDALALVTDILSNFVTRLSLYGIGEYTSTYYSFTLEMITISIMHAPTAYIYNSVEYIWKMHYYDIASHYLPAAGTLASPSARDYDVLTGGHTGFDSYDMRQYVNIFFNPYCTTNAVYNVNECLSSLTANQPTGSLGLNFNRFMWASRQAAGFGYLPVDVFQSITIGNPWRLVEQRYNVALGMERSNFIAPDYSMGSGGDNINHVSDNVLSVAKLAGQPKAGVSVYGTNTYSTNWIRSFLDNQDNPFYGTNGNAGVDNQLPLRQLSAQYQSYQLLTQLALPGKTYLSYSTGDDGTMSLATNILIPLAVDGLYIDGYIAPTAVNTSITIPKTSLFTVAHGNAAVVIRLLYSENSPTSTFQDASSVRYNTAYDTIQPFTGSRTWSYTWQVDSESLKSGSGRLIVMHKKAKVDKNARGPYHVSWLWGAGTVKSWTEIRALQTVIQKAQWTQTFSDVPYRDQYSVYHQKWDTKVVIGNSVTLQVTRQDYSTQWNNDPLFSYGQGQFYYWPWCWTAFSRKVNGNEVLNFASGATPFKVTPIAQANYYQPHLQYLAGSLQLNSKAAVDTVSPTSQNDPFANAPQQIPPPPGQDAAKSKWWMYLIYALAAVAGTSLLGGTIAMAVKHYNKPDKLTMKVPVLFDISRRNSPKNKQQYSGPAVVETASVTEVRQPGFDDDISQSGHIEISESQLQVPAATAKTGLSSRPNSRKQSLTGA